MSTPRPANAPGASLTSLASLVRGEVHGDPTGVATGVTLDSRAVQPGDVYAALPGAQTHGARFASHAVASGAIAVLTDPQGRELMGAATADIACIVVDNPRGVLGEVAAAIHATSAVDLRLIGITGTNGKTTTAYLIDSALRALDKQTGLIGTIETRIGTKRLASARTTPEATDLHAILAVMAEAETDVCVMEVSSHALSQHRVDGVEFDVAVFTNLSQDHLDYHADMEDYFAAKAMLFDPERARRGVICIDDEWGRRLARETRVPSVTVTSKPGRDADWTISAHPDDPTRFRLSHNEIHLELCAQLPGDFNIVNTAMAAVALLVIGEQPDEVRAAILTDPQVPGRMQTVSPPGHDDAEVLAVVDYAHSPDAVAAALVALRPRVGSGPTSDEGAALVVVLGAGGDRDRGKRPGMGEAAARAADIVVVTDDNPRSEDPAAIRARVLEGARQADHAATIVEVAGRREAIRQAIALARHSGRGSVVAVFGKGHETGQEIDGVIHPFDDRDEVAAALTAYPDPTSGDPRSTGPDNDPGEGA